jgi:hypothetical protein
MPEIRSSKKQGPRGKPPQFKRLNSKVQIQNHPRCLQCVKGTDTRSPILILDIKAGDTGCFLYCILSKLELLVLEYEDVQNCFVAPSKGPISRGQNPSDVPYTFASGYNQQEAWPEKPVTVSEPYVIRNCRGVTVRLCPFQYFSSTGTLRVFRRVSVQVYCEATSSANR